MSQKQLSLNIVAVLFLLRRARIKPQVGEKNWLCFWETAINGRTPADVAEELGMSVGSVYTAKCRMISRIRKAVASYVDQPSDVLIDKVRHQ